MKNSSIITKVTLPALAILALAVFGSSTVWGQSAGANFTASVDNTVCSINSATGVFNDMFTQGSGGELKVQIKLPNSSPGLLVTPSLVTGLYTNTLATETQTTKQTAAIVVTVKDEQVGYPTVFLTPNQTCVNATDGLHCGVVYDERFQQLSTVLGSGESVQLILSTLGAHSFNFTRANVPGGIHTITLNWYFGCDANGDGTLSTAECRNPMAFAPNTAAACAGPGTFTVTQVQQFQHSSQIGTTVGTGP
jgi:hypothetical protein